MKISWDRPETETGSSSGPLAGWWDEKYWIHFKGFEASFLKSRSTSLVRSWNKSFPFSSYYCSNTSVSKWFNWFLPGRLDLIGPHPSVPSEPLSCSPAPGSQWCFGSAPYCSGSALSCSLSLLCLTCCSCRRSWWREKLPPPWLHLHTLRKGICSHRRCPPVTLENKKK